MISVWIGLVWFVFPSDFRRHRRRFSMSTSIFDGCALIIGLMWQFIPNESIYNVKENTTSYNDWANERTNDRPKHQHHKCSLFVLLLTISSMKVTVVEKLKRKWISRWTRRRIIKKSNGVVVKLERHREYKRNVGLIVEQLNLFYLFSFFTFFFFVRFFPHLLVVSFSFSFRLRNE